MKKKFTDADYEEFYFFQCELYNSLDINPEYLNFENVKTFGDFVELIVGKVDGQEKEYCISQVTFYKLRKELSEILQIERNTIHLNSSLDNLVTLKQRRFTSQELDLRLNASLKILTPPSWIKLALGLSLVFSLIVLFAFNFKYGFLLTGITIGLIYLLNKFALSFKDNNLREMALRLSKTNYSSFKPKGKINKKEISELIYSWATEYFGWNNGKLYKDIKFVL
jgi:hypothetical protein